MPLSCAACVTWMLLPAAARPDRAPSNQHAANQSKPSKYSGMQVQLRINGNAAACEAEDCSYEATAAATSYITAANLTSTASLGSQLVIQGAGFSAEAEATIVKAAEQASASRHADFTSHLRAAATNESTAACAYACI